MPNHLLYRLRWAAASTLVAAVALSSAIRVQRTRHRSYPGIERPRRYRLSHRLIKISYRISQSLSISESTTYDVGAWVNLGGGVTLYRDRNYSGVAETIAGDDANLRDNPIGNDAGSSIRVLSGRDVTLYADSDYREPSETFVADDPDLRNNPIGDDNVGSIRLRYSDHHLPASMAIAMRVEIYDSGERHLKTESLDLSDTFGQGWVHVGRAIATPPQAAKARIDVGTLGASDSALIDDFTFQPSPGIPPRPLPILQSAVMPYNTNRPTIARQHLYYLKIERHERTYTGFYSADGFTWHQVGPAITVDWPRTYVGLVVYAGDSSDTCDANFDWLRVVDLEGAPHPTPTATPTPTSTPTPTATPTPTPTVPRPTYDCYLPWIVEP